MPKHRRSPPRAAAHGPKPAPAAPLPRVIRIAWLMVALLAIARAGFAFAPGMAAWGLDLLRFVPPAWWAAWAVAALALVPPVARAAERRVERMARALERVPARGRLAWAAVPAALVLLFPDRVFFVGDFQLREVASHTGRSIFASLYPQGLPLDALLHDRLVRALAPAFHLGPLGVGRLIGALEAALLGALAFRFARVLELRGTAGFAAAAMVAFGGTLALYTGYDKAFAEMTLLAVAVAALGIEAARRGTGILALGIALALGLGLHRLAIAFVPAVTVAIALAARGPLRARGWSAAAIAGVAIPVVALAVMGPRLVRLLAGFDRAANFAPDAVRREGVWAAALAGQRLADLANLLLLLVPLAPLALLVFASPRLRSHRAEAAVLAALAVPLLGFVPFFHPPQGIFRDWDGFAASAMAMSLVAAWTVGGILEAFPRAAWLGVAIVAGTIAPTLQWLAHHSDPARGLTRVEAYLKGPPPRTDLTSASGWDFLGMRSLDLGRRDQAAAAFERAAAIAPSPKILRAWAATEIERGNLEQARAIYRRLLERAPQYTQGWIELALLASRIGDLDGARRAARRAVELSPDDRRARSVLEGIEGRMPPAAE